MSEEFVEPKAHHAWLIRFGVQPWAMENGNHLMLFWCGR